MCGGATIVKEEVEKEESGYRIQIKTEISISHSPNLEVQQARFQQVKEQTRETAIPSGKWLGAYKIYYEQLRVWSPGSTEAVAFATGRLNATLQKHPIFRAFLFPQQKQLACAFKHVPVPRKALQFSEAQN